MFNPFNTNFTLLQDQVDTNPGPPREIADILPGPSYCFNKNVIKISKCKTDADTIFNIINNFFSNIETLTTIYDPSYWRWKLEYSKPHINHIMDYATKNLFESHKRKIIEVVCFAKFMKTTGFKLSELLAKNMKNFLFTISRFDLAHECSQIAAKKYPHNKIDWDEMFDYIYDIQKLPTLGGPRFWGEYVLTFYQTTHFYELEFITLRNSSRSTLSYLFQTLRDELNERNFCWEPRKSFLSFFEGLERGIGLSVHIERYIMNELIIKEVCSFLK